MLGTVWCDLEHGGRVGEKVHAACELPTGSDGHMGVHFMIFSILVSV